MKSIKMRSREILVSLLTIVTLVALAVTVSAVDTLNMTAHEVYFDSIDLEASSGMIAGISGDIVPVRVYFTANEDAEDVEIAAWIRGNRDNMAEKELPDLISGKEYNARLSLNLPSDLDEIDEELTLYIRIESDAGNWDAEYTVNVQRDDHKTEVLFVEADNIVKAGSTVPVEVVISNIGRHELDDMIVSLRIPSLGVEKRAYFGDLTPTDDEDDYGDDAEDSVARRIFVNIPTNAQVGIYTLEVEAYNEDTSSSVTKNIAITGSEEGSKVLTSVTSQEVARNRIIAYDLIIVNSGNNIGVYEIIPETTTNIVVTPDQPLVTVAAGSSKVVPVYVQAGDSIGTYNFAVNVESEGQLVDRVNLAANVVKGKAVRTSNIFILTIVLAVIFVVLLIVLIVLLSRKPEKAEEFGESYY